MDSFLFRFSSIKSKALKKNLVMHSDGEADNPGLNGGADRSAPPNGRSETPVDSVISESLDVEGLRGMSLVSPPFTPTQSTIDLVHGAGRDEVPENLDIRVHSQDLHRQSHVRDQLVDDLPRVWCVSRARIPTTAGTEMFLHLYRNNIDDKEHLAIVYGDDIHSQSLFEHRPGETEQDRMTRGAYTGKLYPGRIESGASEDLKKSPLKRDVLCRIHSECYTGETAWSARCDCGEQLDEASRLMSAEGHGVIVYLRQEGRGIGLAEKLKAYNLQDLGADTVQANLMLRHPADSRSFSLATAILADLGLLRIRLLTNNPDKIVAVEGKEGLVKVTARVPMIPLSWQKRGGFRSDEVEKYLSTKVQRMGHLLDLADSPSKR